MSPTEPTNTRVLILAADDFEDMELLYPLYRLREEQIEVTLASLDGQPLTGKKGHGAVEPDAATAAVSADVFDPLVIPGGVRARQAAAPRPRPRSGEIDVRRRRPSGRPRGRGPSRCYEANPPPPRSPSGTGTARSSKPHELIRKQTHEQGKPKTAALRPDLPISRRVVLC